MEQRLCRYCQQPERKDVAEGELIAPCRCSGDLKWVHLSCLRRHQQQAARRSPAGLIAAMLCEVCGDPYFVGHPSVQAEDKAASQAVLNQLRPGTLLVRRRSNGPLDRWAKSVILLAAKKPRSDAPQGSPAQRILDNQGGESLLIGFVLTAEKQTMWHVPPPQAQPQMPPQMRAQQQPPTPQRLPGGPVKDFGALLHTVPSIKGAVPVPLNGEATANKQRLLYLSPASATQSAVREVQRSSAGRTALLYECNGAAVWTDTQIEKEVVGGSWGVVPATEDHIRRVGDVRMWEELLQRAAFATPLIEAADEKAVQAANVSRSPAEAAALSQRKQRYEARETRLLQAAAPQGGRLASRAANAASAGREQPDESLLKRLAACALPVNVSGDGGSAGDAVDDMLCNAIVGAMGSSTRFVLIGESSHGTQQFYELRARLTRHLIAHHGFRAVVVEGDWPAAQRAHRYVCGRALKDRSARDALGDFTARFPEWLWRNEPTASFLEWLKKQNERREAEERPPCGFYGMDLYSLHTSADKVIEYLQGVDAAAAKEAKEAFAVFEAFRNEPSEYGKAMASGQLKQPNGRVVDAIEVQRKLERVLGQLQTSNAKKYEYQVHYNDEKRLDAEVNMEVVVNAEQYYRECWQLLGQVTTWNVRDQHMMQVLMRLDNELRNSATSAGPSEGSRGPRVVVWAHNSHCGDVRATEARNPMLQRLTGGEPKWSLAHLCRETFGRESVYIIGQDTYSGSVSASPGWGQPMQCFSLHPGLAGSQSDLIHQILPRMKEVHPETVSCDGLMLLFSDRADEAPGYQNKGEETNIWEVAQNRRARRADPRAATEAKEALLESLGSNALRQARVRTTRELCYPTRILRAVGVNYRRSEERQRHYMDCCLPEFADAWIFLDKTDALKPIDVTPEWTRGRAEGGSTGAAASLMPRGPMPMPPPSAASSHMSAASMRSRIRR